MGCVEQWRWELKVSQEMPPEQLWFAFIFYLILQMCVVYTVQNGGLGFIMHVAEKSGVTNSPPSGL